MTILPSIVTTRLLEAIVDPNVPRWHSLGDMVDAMIRLCEKDDPESPMLPRLRRVADFCRKQQTFLLQPGVKVG